MNISLTCFLLKQWIISTVFDNRYLADYNILFIVSEDSGSDTRSSVGGGLGGHETDDEGIERDSGECDDSDGAGPSHPAHNLQQQQQPTITLADVLDTCARRVTGAASVTTRYQQADNHYR